MRRRGHPPCRRRRWRRGARRIITGTGGEFYYPANHYDSFVRVDVSR
ncbi:MAG TPA: ribonuclease domain-containing protein [Jatrophihabitantaceae bacterium]